jgi:thiosulfate/3-mercaptopyruvate sulfurtransferase
VDLAIEDVVRRLGEEGFVILDVRSSGEYAGAAVAPCDPRPGRIPGARHLDIQDLMTLTQEQICERLGPADEVELVAYCHSGARSQLATEILCAAGYRAFNYRGSWHEWSRDESLPAETG